MRTVGKFPKKYKDYDYRRKWMKKARYKMPNLRRIQSGSVIFICGLLFVVVILVIAVIDYLV